LPACAISSFVLLAFGFIAWLTVGAHAAELLNVSYDPTRELYKPSTRSLPRSGRPRPARTSPSSSRNGGSGKQARSVIDGLGADV